MFSLDVSYNYSNEENKFVATYTVMPEGKAFSSKTKALNYIQEQGGPRDPREVRQKTLVFNPQTGQQVGQENEDGRTIEIKVWTDQGWQTRALDLKLSSRVDDLDVLRKAWSAMTWSGPFAMTLWSPVFGSEGLRLIGKARHWAIERDAEVTRPFVYLDVPETGPIRVGASMGPGWATDDFLIVPRGELQIAISLSVSLAGVLGNWKDLAEFWKRWNDELDIMWDFEDRVRVHSP